MHHSLGEMKSLCLFFQTWTDVPKMQIPPQERAFLGKFGTSIGGDSGKGVSWKEAALSDKDKTRMRESDRRWPEYKYTGK